MTKLPKNKVTIEILHSDIPANPNIEHRQENGVVKHLHLGYYGKEELMVFGGTTKEINQDVRDALQMMLSRY